MGRFSQIRQPLVRDVSIRAWQLFDDIDPRDAKKQRFDNLHDCWVHHVTRHAGDTWNVNSITLKRVHKRLCRHQ